MKKVLAVVLAAAFISLTAVGAYAQIPFVQWYFDNTMTQTTADCDGSTFQTGFVTAVNFNQLFSSVEYSVSYPWQMVWFADQNVNTEQLNIGNTPTGVASAWSLPMNGFGPIIIMRVIYNWHSGCTACQGNQNGPIVVGAAFPIEPTGKVRFIRFPDNLEFEAVGMTSMVCPSGVPVEDTSWGRVKALYQD
jgi:hypothetical protein